MKKRFISLIVISVLLCTNITGCKSEEVKNAEKLISQIGTVTVDSWDEIEAAENALNSLSGKDYQKVSNLEDFEKAQQDFNGVIDYWNGQVEVARALANQEDSNQPYLSMTTLSEGIDMLKEIRAELPDEVVDRYIVFNSDMTMDEWINEMTELISEACYPGTTCLKFDVWYSSVTGAFALNTSSESYEYQYYLAATEESSRNRYYIYDIEEAYEDYVMYEGYYDQVLCYVDSDNELSIIYYPD